MMMRYSKITAFKSNSKITLERRKYRFIKIFTMISLNTNNIKEYFSSKEYCKSKDLPFT